MKQIYTFTLKQARVYAGMSKDELAKVLKISVSTVQDYEHQKRLVNKEIANAWADACGIAREDIIADVKENKK